jgi:hypothetical protein
MKVRYYLTGLILIIFGFIVFSLIGVLNRYTWMNFTYHIIVTLIGFIFIFLGILSMIIFLKGKDTREHASEEEIDIIGNKKDSFKSNLEKKKSNKEK